MTYAKSEKGKRAYLKGLIAETLAKVWLVAKGYRILAKRYQAGVGEIDLIAHKKGTLVAVEVKARGCLTQALESLTHHQKERIARAISLYAARHPRHHQDDIRLDFFLLMPWRVCHIKGAWDTSMQ
ncbi:MAG: YraN family protein [Proteobacteria bacterium]|nr:YraN family protein [Pseudomonadota bacterium]